MKAIKSMNRGATFTRLFDDLVVEMRRAYFSVQFSQHALSNGQDVMVALTVVAGFYIGTQVWSMHHCLTLLVLGIIYYQVITLVKKIQEHMQQQPSCRGRTRH